MWDTVSIRGAAATETDDAAQYEHAVIHEHLSEYSERLIAMLPEPLSVVYLVNSGSEANELAWRLAQAHTIGSDVIVLDCAYHGNTTR